MPIQQIIFYVSAAACVFSACMVVISPNPVRGALFLVATFFASAVLWLLLEAEFLALILVLVYVGAVMTLFLFVVMTLNLSTTGSRGLARHLPLGIAVIALMIGLAIYALGPAHFSLATLTIPNHPADYSNIKDLGSVLYTQYAYPFELAAVLLLAAIVAAISLDLRPERHRKLQDPAQQVTVRREDRIRLIKVPSAEKPKD